MIMFSKIIDISVFVLTIGLLGTFVNGQLGYEHDWHQLLEDKTPRSIEKQVDGMGNSVLRNTAVRSQSQSSSSSRQLQTSGGTVPDLIAPTNLCAMLGGLYFQCDLFQRFGNSGEGQEYTDLNTTVVCGFSVETGFDFRRIPECTCSTLLTPSNTSRLPKVCPCFVCPRGFGSASFSIDCSYLIDDETIAPTTIAPTGDENVTETESPTATMAPSDYNETEKPDPYIFEDCVSVDCGANCNGTCSVGCTSPVAALNCPFCNVDFTEPPTGPPLADGGDSGLPTIGEGATPEGESPSSGFTRTCTIIGTFFLAVVLSILVVWE